MQNITPTQHTAKQHSQKQNFAKKCVFIAFNVVFVLLSMCYPLGLYFGGNLCVIAGIMTIAWGIKAFVGFGARSGFWILSAIFCLIFMLLFFKEIFALDFGLDGFSTQVAYFYPSLVYMLLLSAFSISLKGEAIITTFAAFSHGAKRVKDLPKEVQRYLVPYTRTLTTIYIGYFALCGIISFVLASLEDKLYWSVFCGGVCYVALGLLFGIEWLYRTLYFIPKQQRKISSLKG